MTSAVAFDADVLIYAADASHPYGGRIRGLLESPEISAVGSVLLLAEVLTKPMRASPESEETAALLRVLSRLTLLPLTLPTARLSLSLATAHGLRAADAAHLASAVTAGAGSFITNNRKDFPRTISEIEVVYPENIEASFAGQ